MKTGILSIIILVFFALQTSAQNEMFKALYMYNFIKNIDWPSSYKRGDFVIGVVGKSDIIKELEEIAKRKKAGFQPIVIKQFKSLNEIYKCHVLFLPSDKSELLEEAITRFSQEPVVIITDQKGLIEEGANINYVKIKGKQKFEINEHSLIQRGLKITPYLTSLATNINENVE